MNTSIRRVLVAPAILLAAFGLAGCATNETAPAESGPEVVQETDAFAISDAWIKATDTDMTGVFGTITNNGDTDFTIVSAEAEIAGMTELHETIVQSDGSSLMQEVEGGYIVPAGEDYILEPGGNHIMLMMLKEDILPGDEIMITVVTSEGDEFEFSALAKEYTGAQETYAPESGHEGTGDETSDQDRSTDQDQTRDPDHTPEQSTEQEHVTENDPDADDE